MCIAPSGDVESVNPVFFKNAHRMHCCETHVLVQPATNAQEMGRQLRVLASLSIRFIC